MRTHPLIAWGAVALLSISAEPSLANSVLCITGFSKCVSVQGKDVPVTVAEAMAVDCADLTRNNAGARAMRLSTAELLALTNGNINHPLMRASVAADNLHDSPLVFERSKPFELRYPSMRAACGQVFRDLRIAPPSMGE